MTSKMKRISMLMLLASTAAFAQVPPGEIAADSDSGVEDSPCVSAGESSPQVGEQGDGALDAVPCEEQKPETASGEEQYPAEAPGETVADAEVIEQVITGAEVSAEEEFEPGDEISEDYPVPLPADI